MSLCVLALGSSAVAAQPSVKPSVPVVQSAVAREAPVQITGTVVYADATSGIFLQSGTETIRIDAAGAALAVSPGDRVEVSGLAAERDGRRWIAGAQLHRLGTGPLPPGRPIPVAALGTDQSTDDWVTLDTVVREVLPAAHGSELRVAIDDALVAISVPTRIATPDVFVDAVLRVRGVRTFMRSPQGMLVGVRILVPRLAADDIISAQPAPAFDLPVQSVASARRISARKETPHRIRMRGTVVVVHSAITPNHFIVHVQDATGTLASEIDGGAVPERGDIVDIVAFPSTIFGTPLMTAAVARRVGHADLPAAVPASVAELLAGRHAGQLVRLRGTFERFTSAPGAQILAFTSGGTSVSGYFYDLPAHRPLPTLREGSVVDLTGVTAIFGDNAGAPQTMIMVLQEPESIVVVSVPSWWTPLRLAAAAGGAAGLCALAFLWVGVLNAKVRKQTRDLTVQFERTAALQRRWSDLVANASDVILTWNLDGRLTSLNQTGQTTLGLTEEEALTRTIDQIVSPQSVAEARALMSARDRDALTLHELEVRDADGQDVPLELTVQPMLENGQRLGFQGIGRNMTAHKRVERALRQARDAAENANRAKSEFLANMSHEIRTPMNGIIGMTELALATDLSDLQREYLDTVKESAESLLGLLNDILDSSKIESHKLELESIPFAIRDLAAETLKPLGFKADAKGLELLCDISPDVPEMIVGDPLRLRQILTNLVGNALKFTERGHVLIEIQEDKRGAGCTALHFKVTDTGVGIPRDKQAIIFEPFRQMDGSTTRRYGGTGLGLAISGTLVRLMGGRIWVESEPPAGSTFHFTGSFDVASAIEPAQFEPLLENLPVLIVDDNGVNRRILSEQLARWKMKATLAESGSAALEALTAAADRGKPYLLVLLDANMPEIDGFGVAERIRTRPDLAGATIMMLTSSGEYGDTERCKALNISAYLTKPIAAKYLLDAICRVLGRGVQTPAAPAPPERVVQEPVRRRKVLLAEDNIVNQKVASGLLAKRGHDTTVVGNGREALEALERETFDVVLMDVQMPEMDGLQATAAIRQREAGTGEHVRIVAMTAHAMNGDRDQCLSAGMDGYLAKPVDSAMLYAVVEDDAPRRAEERASVPSTDTDELLQRLGGDQELFTEVIQAFLDDCPARLAAIKSAVDCRDAELVRTTAHALKGAAGNLSATALFAAAKTLEQLGAERRVEAFEAAWRQLSTEASNVLDGLRRYEVTRSNTNAA